MIEQILKMKKKEFQKDSRQRRDATDREGKISDRTPKPTEQNTDRRLISGNSEPLERKKQRNIIVMSNEKLKNIRKLYSNLEQKEEEQDQLFNYATSQHQMDAVSSAARSILKNAKNKFQQSVFQVNHYLLTNQIISEAGFQLIMFFEFIQILFFIFYKIVIRNEFQQIPSNLSTDSVPSVPQIQYVFNSTVGQKTNETLSNDLIAANFLSSQDSIDSLQLVTFYNVFEFANFQVYFLKNHDMATYEIIYDILVVGFFGLLLLLAFTSYRIQKLLRSEQLSEGLKILCKVFSVVVIIFIYLLEIPTITVLLERFICEEDIVVSEYSLNDVICDDSYYKGILGVSAAILVIYLGYLILQYQLHASSRFNGEFPWSGLQRDVPIVRSLLKFILVGGFVFGKDMSATLQAYISFGCIPLAVYVVVKRLTTVIYFNTKIQFMATLYDMLIALLLCITAAHVVITKNDQQNEMSVATFIIIGLSSGVFTCLGLYWQQLRIEQGLFRTFTDAKDSQFSSSLEGGVGIQGDQCHQYDFRRARFEINKVKQHKERMI